jgi:hypothetical protein
LSVIGGKENIHLAHTSAAQNLDDHAGFLPELRENYYLRHILNDWNAGTF